MAAKTKTKQSPGPKKTVFLGRVSGNALDDCWVQLIEEESLTKKQLAEINPDERAFFPRRHALLVRLAGTERTVVRAMNTSTAQLFWACGDSCWRLGNRDGTPAVARHRVGHDPDVHLLKVDGAVPPHVGNRVLGRDETNVVIWQHASLGRPLEASRIWRFDGGSWMALPDVPAGFVQAVTIDARGTIWAVGAEWGAHRLRGGAWEWVPFAPTPTSFGHGSVVTSIAAHGDAVWVSTNHDHLYGGVPSEMTLQWNGPIGTPGHPKIAGFQWWRDELVVGATSLYESKAMGVARLVLKDGHTGTLPPRRAEMLVECAFVRGHAQPPIVDPRERLLAASSGALYEHDGTACRSIEVGELAPLFSDHPPPWAAKKP